MGSGFAKLLHRLRPWVPALLWAVVISYASTDTFSSSNTSVIILPILRRLLPFASPETLDSVHYLIRKLAHLSEYFLFSLLLMRGVRGNNRGWKLRWAIWALAIAAGYSALDEFHQSYVPSRTASPWDSLLDTTGAAAAQVVLYFWVKLRARGSVTGD